MNRILKMFFFIAMMVCTVISVADTYKIIAISDGGYIIKNKNIPVREKDKITDTDMLIIKPNQTVIIRNEATMRRSVLLGSNYCRRKCSSIKSFFKPAKKKTAYRGEYNASDLAKVIGNEIVWTDSMAIQTYFDRDIGRGFILEVHEGNGEKTEKLLTTEDVGRRICFFASDIWGEKEPYEIIVDIKMRITDRETQKYADFPINTNIKLIPYKDEIED